MSYVKIFFVLILSILVSFGVFFLHKSTPKVSVILLTHNRHDLLPRALDSILNQTYQNFELIVINDASSDNTAEVLENYRVKDKRVRVINNETNQGIVPNRNKGIFLSTGKYITWQDDDDVSEPTRLEEQVRFLEKHNDITILGTQISLLNSERMIYLWPTETDPEKAEIAFLIGRMPIVLTTGMWRADFIKKHKIFFDESVPLVEEFAIYDKLFAHGGKMMTLNKSLYQYRIHRTNPQQYYDKIMEIQSIIYKDRWKKFFPNFDFPEMTCERLNYVRTHNRFFRQNLLDEMYMTHCKSGIYDPTYTHQKIVYEDGYEDHVIFSINTGKFYSERKKKGGKVIGKEKGKIKILWNGETTPQIY